MGQALATEGPRLGVGGHPLTDEQCRILAHAPTKTLKCLAFAGCAKTSTAIEYTHAWSQYRGLYLAFNAAIAGEAKGKFPPNIQTQTAHGHAYQVLGMSRYRDRIVTRLRPHDLDACNDLLRPVSNMTEISLKRALLRSLNNFLISADHKVVEGHLSGFPVAVRKACVPMVSAVIERLMDYENTELPITHDIYLKAFSRTCTIASHFDYLIVDEAQDLNPVLIDIVRRADRPAMIIGDPYQSIYAFRGATSAMEQFAGETLPLSQSFRFGPRIADIANHILRHSLVKPALPVKGFPAQRSTVVEYQGRIKAKTTILARTNFRLFEGLVQLPLRFHVIGGIEEMLSQVAAGYALFNEDRKGALDPLVSRFQTWEQCKDAAEAEDEPELTRLVRIVEQYTSAIPEILVDLRKRHSADERGAEIILSTAHKAKGREWDHVVIMDDFLTPHQLSGMLGRKRITPSEYTSEINLLYVAGTRGRCTLSISQPLYDELAGGGGLADQLFDPM